VAAAPRRTLLGGLQRTLAWIDAGVAAVLAVAALFWMHTAHLEVLASQRSAAPASNPGALAWVNAGMFLIPALLAAFASAAMFRRWPLRWLAQVPVVLAGVPLLGELALSGLLALLAPGQNL
jgi:hypothetical protein